MALDAVSIKRHSAKLFIAAALLIGGACGDGNGSSDGGGGSGAAGAGGRGGANAGGRGGTSAGGRGGGGGSAGTTGAAGDGTAGGGGTAGAAGATGGSGGTTSRGGAGGGTAGASGGSAGAAGGTAGAGGGSAGAGGRGGAGGAAGTGGAGGGKAGSGGDGGGKGGTGGGGGGGGKAGTGGAAGQKGDCGTTDCSSTQYCDWQNNQCGVGVLVVGMCVTRPQVCTAVADPVCGCDGQVYSNSCMAAAAGQDIDESGSGCKPPSETFACGPRFCNQGTQYCEAMIGGPAGGAGTYACHLLPTACGSTPTCACLVGTAQCGNCQMSNDGDLTTRCLFP